MSERIERFRARPPARVSVLAVEIPLLIECGLEAIVDEVLVVVGEPQTQVSRLTKRSGVSVAEAKMFWSSNQSRPQMLVMSMPTLL